MLHKLMPQFNSVSGELGLEAWPSATESQLPTAMEWTVLKHAKRVNKLNEIDFKCASVLRDRGDCFQSLVCLHKKTRRSFPTRFGVVRG
ncbi:hypothetical protein NBRC116594_03840 [Shimia sp. NS0008-38b]